MAVEAAVGVAPPPRAVALRGVMGELERIHNHLNDWGFVCNDAAFAYACPAAASCGRACCAPAAVAFGHRLMMDRVVPGGVTDDLTPDGAAAILAALDAVEGAVPGLLRSMKAMPACRTAWSAPAALAPALARRFAAGGFVGRASGRDFDARAATGYPPYDGLRFEVPVLPQGDVDARVLGPHRRGRCRASIAGRAMLAGCRKARCSATLPQRAGEGIGLVEGFRGDVLAWVRAGRRRPYRALPPARSVLVPMAAAGGRDRGQHRRRLPALQQDLQLFLLGARPVMQPLMRKLLFERPAAARRSPSRRRRSTMPRSRAGRAARPRGAAPARPQPVDPRGRCRLLQRLRAGDPRAQQRVLRPGALRPALRRLAAPCRCAAGHRAGDHATCDEAPGAHLARDAGSQMGGGGRRLRRWMAACSRAATACVGGVVGGGAGRPGDPRLSADADAVAGGAAGAAGGAGGAEAGLKTAT